MDSWWYGFEPILYTLMLRVCLASNVYGLAKNISIASHDRITTAGGNKLILRYIMTHLDDMIQICLKANFRVKHLEDTQCSQSIKLMFAHLWLFCRASLWFCLFIHSWYTHAHNFNLMQVLHNRFFWSSSFIFWLRLINSVPPPLVMALLSQVVTLESFAPRHTRESVNLIEEDIYYFDSWKTHKSDRNSCVQN